jgi:uncharacterized membrane protein YbjE (DUF340 family)
MESLAGLASILASLLLGGLAHRLGLRPKPRAAEAAIKIALYALLLLMGLKLGATEGLFERMGRIGALGAGFALATAGGSVLAIALGYALLRRWLTPDPAAPVGAPVGKPSFDLAGPASMVGMVALGFCAALMMPKGFPAGAAAEWVLYALLFLIGLQMAMAGINPFKVLASLETALIPFATALGSLAGAWVLAAAAELAAGPSLAVGGGFGWYSLSSTLILGMGDAEMAAVALLSNLLRESIAILAIPFVGARWPGIAIGLGGATSMDVTLPLIEQASGPSHAPRAIASGAFLSLLVPFVVPALYCIG